MCSSLDGALEALDKDREFLKVGGVFTDDFIHACIEVKMKEVTRNRASTHPLEFRMYYSLCAGGACGESNGRLGARRRCCGKSPTGSGKTRKASAAMTRTKAVLRQSR